MQPEKQPLWRSVLYPVIAFILVIGIWWGAVEFYQVPRYVMPSPADVWAHILDDYRTLWIGFQVTFKEFLIGFVLGAVSGFVMAVLMDTSKTVRGVLYPILIVSQAIPIIAISAALTIWLGFGLAPKLVIVALVVFFPVVVNVLDGLRSVDGDLLRLARSMGGTRWSIFRHVKMPATLTPLFSALKLSATFSVTGAVIAEWSASTSGGIGAYLMQANSRLNTSGTFAAIAYLALLGLVAFVLVILVEYLLTPWRNKPMVPRWSTRFWRK
ncbi:ABC transporter permease [Cohaesibacter celericrescens]|uniref:ABC transporter permease n=1 Tax=Cohaesibacter celericrescens TaxID=2067669 RepID=A0A2N5XNE0_9HYPH|nr:ABC transporter permease [Cohaesibacter celericrescens]PLW76056.1 ABC transporter permease [Cohaesibacter celericrescens]